MFLVEWMRTLYTFLYNVLLNILLFGGNGTEQRRRLDSTPQEMTEDNVQTVRRTPNIREGEDTVDFVLAGDLQNSLEKVSEAIYKKFVSVWHSPPGEIQNQPLYKEINSLIQNVFFNIKRKARLFEEYKIVISIASDLTAHFINKKGKEVTYRFKTRQEEVDFIRKNVKCLLDYWLPESMQRPPLIYVFLTEILSVNVLELMINYYSEFKNINEAIVEALDDKPDAKQKEDSGKCEKNINGNRPDESHTMMESDNIASRKTEKKEKKGVKEKCKGLVKRLRLKKSKSGNGIKFRSCASTHSSDGDDVDMGSIDDDEEDENPIKLIINTSLQMWQQNDWDARVFKILKEEGIYEISVYDKSAPDYELWKTKRRVNDFKDMYEKVCQDYSDFIKFTKQDTAEGPPDAEEEFFHSIGITPDDFINVLVNLVKTRSETKAAFFFSPFRNEDDIREHLKCDPSDEEHTDDESTKDSGSSEMESNDCGLGYRTLNTQNEEEQFNNDIDPSSLSSDLHNALGVSSNRDKSRKDEESIVDSSAKESDPKDCYQADGLKFPRLGKKNKKCQSASHIEQDKVSSSSVTAEEEFPSQNADRRGGFSNIQYQSPNVMDSHPQPLPQKGLDWSSQNITQTIEEQKKELQETLLDVVYKLIDEVLAGGTSGIYYLHKIGLLKNQSKSILNSIANIYAEEKIIWYLNLVADLLMSEIRPLQLPPYLLQSKALGLLENKVRGSLNFVFKKWIMKNLKASHQALQDPVANKETIYRLLEDLTKIITDEGSVFNPVTVH
ncbi:uncharacterized protein [Dendropsophus ebraccatus]|uniref:uncharacterized protein n=1 Tax=Dendropsophus ebraccatus TaxID=150705 RepID=UPI0038320E57